MEKLQQLLTKSVNQKSIHGLTLAINSPKVDWCGGAGNLSCSAPFFIASTTKLFVTALILQSVDEKRLSLETPIQHFFSDEFLTGLHTYQGRDYSKQITIQQLLWHSSGISDYFQQKDQDGNRLDHALFAQNDRAWSFEETVERSKMMPAKFAPDTPGKAFYSDTNYQLLGRILELIHERSLAELIDERIAQRLQLTNTYLYTDASDQRPMDMYYKRQPLHIPQAMTSFRGDGGVVSTSPELLTFIQGFFSGALFDAKHIPLLLQWKKSFFPFDSGIGLQRFKLPTVFTLFQRMPEFHGHSGLSGAFAWYAPERELYVAGTVNQIEPPSLSFKLILKALKIVS
jgi:CubicO group peptidase (beta-lactamase class C family)